MKNLDFIGSLLPSFAKSRMTEDLNNLMEELRTTTLPPYTAMAKAYGKSKFQSEDLRRFQDMFTKEVKTFKGSYVSVIEQTLKTVEEKGPILEKMISEYYADDVMRTSMTFFKVNVLQYLEGIHFFMKYARKLLVWTVTLETMAVDKDAVSEDTIIPADVEWLNTHRQVFFHITNILGGNRNEMEKAFKEIPDITITKDNAPIIEKTVGPLKVDPFHFGLIPIKLNPFYHVRMLWSEWQVARRDAAQREKEVIEMRLLYLRNLESGKKDARIEKQIAYYESELQKVNIKIHKLEKDDDA